ncbi:restriction endonuclease subunit S [Haloferula sp. A504]|uniref:restriction endonuclease subunit S n=1 Tax=Haloferula sp. A504 TaxID=3373601 RepID=UPI0031C671C6|nr:restriction endonuclease subunit S [Verrucomicrobiaceae bacterium E54]
MLDRSKNKGEPCFYLRNINVRWFSIDLSDLKEVRIAEQERDKFSVRDGDVFVCEGGEPGRASVWRGGDSQLVYQKALLRFRSNGSVIPEWIAYRLRLDAANRVLEDFFSGTTIKHFTRKSFLNYSLPVPPLAEQKRIADKLEVLLGRVDACRARLDRLPALLKRFRQSVLAAATSGKLTEEWRVEEAVGDDWHDTQVQDIAQQIFDGPFGSHLKTVDYTSSGIRVARLENIGWMNFHADKEAFISPAKYKTLTRHTLKSDDVLFSSFISEETRVAVLPDSWSGNAINKSDCYCIRADQQRCLPKFLMLRLACRSTFHLLAENVHGATRPRINLGQLKSFTFALPSLAEQQEIVHRVEALFAFADRIESGLAEARKLIDRLTPATLAKAFRGELAPQDPNDEPAARLLEHLAASSPTP